MTTEEITAIVLSEYEHWKNEPSDRGHFGMLASANILTAILIPWHRAPWHPPANTPVPPTSPASPEVSQTAILRKIKLAAQTANNADHALSHIIGLCFDAGITENTEELKRPITAT